VIVPLAGAPRPKELLNRRSPFSGVPKARYLGRLQIIIVPGVILFNRGQRRAEKSRENPAHWSRFVECFVSALVNSSAALNYSGSKIAKAFPRSKKYVIYSFTI